MRGKNRVVASAGDGEVEGAKKSFDLQDARFDEPSRSMC